MRKKLVDKQNFGKLGDGDMHNNNENITNNNKNVATDNENVKDTYEDLANDNQMIMIF